MTKIDNLQKPSDFEARIEELTIEHEKESISLCDALTKSKAEIEEKFNEDKIIEYMNESGTKCVRIMEKI